MAEQDAQNFLNDCEDIFSSRMKFPAKLWRIINSNTSGSIFWSDFGKSVTINNALFQREYLDCAHPVFKTKNMTSFVRQLNMYGFRKVQVHQKNACDELSKVHKFRNNDFQHGRPDLLDNVKRRCVPIKKQVMKQMNWKQLGNLVKLRKQFEELLLHTPEFVQFWDTSNEAGKPDLSVVQPKYRLTIIPVDSLDFDNDGSTVTVEVPEEFRYLIADGDLQEESESDEDDEETDDGCDLEAVELSVPAETEEKLFESNLNCPQMGEILNDCPVDPLGDEEQFYASLANSFPIV